MYMYKMGFVADAAYLTLCRFHVRSEVVFHCLLLFLSPYSEGSGSGMTVRDRVTADYRGRTQRKTGNRRRTLLSE